MARIGLAAPWIIFYREVEAMFSEDPEVRVVYDEEKYELKLYVDNPTKAEALQQLLPTAKSFGNVEMKIDIIPSNRFSDSASNLYLAAFLGNNALSYVDVVSGIFTNNLTYVVFRNKVVQYYTDDLSDVNGLTSTLYQYIAKDIFKEMEGVFFCTDLPGEASDGASFGMPLGEWP